MGWGPLNIKPHINSGYLLGPISPFKRLLGLWKKRCPWCNPLPPAIIHPKTDLTIVCFKQNTQISNWHFFPVWVIYVCVFPICLVSMLFFVGTYRDLVVFHLGFIQNTEFPDCQRPSKGWQILRSFFCWTGVCIYLNERLIFLVNVSKYYGNLWCDNLGLLLLLLLLLFLFPSMIDFPILHKRCYSKGGQSTHIINASPKPSKTTDFNKGFLNQWCFLMRHYFLQSFYKLLERCQWRQPLLHFKNVLRNSFPKFFTEGITNSILGRSSWVEFNADQMILLE